MTEPPTVSAVIPTTGRPELTRAIDSAHAQSISVEVIVVWDAIADPPTNLLERAGVRVLRTEGGVGGARARNLGVEASTTQWIAFLDDDDEWLPTKIGKQLAAAQSVESRGRRPIVATQSFTRAAGKAALTTAVPATVYTGGPVEDYLFRGRRLGFQRPALHVPTLFTSLELAREIGWDDSLRRHQDWDWIVRATRLPGVEIVQLAEPLAIVDVGSAGSISASPDWVTTWEWGRSWRGRWNPVTYADFMVGQTARQALVANDVAAALMAVEEARGAARPSAPTMLLGASAVVPRSVLARAAQSVGQVKRWSGRS